MFLGCFSIEDASIGTCREQVCQDATKNLIDITTHKSCATFQTSTPCTTSGFSCINQVLCSSYTIQAGCVQGIDGLYIWASSQNTTFTTIFCRLKQCTDLLLTQSSKCKKEIPVSNEINCIPQSTCSSYTTREACLGGGSFCAFNSGTNTLTSNIGTCSLFTQYLGANSDQIACNSRSDACFVNQTTNNGTTTFQCIPHTCATKALVTSCQPIPSWDLTSYKICVIQDTVCAEGNPSQLTSQTCYITAGTYSWNVNTSFCIACMKKKVYDNTDLINGINSYLVSIANLE
ncbi:hypothetical protein pb186bvf_015982 [Paramecium bursaria]